jgi:hypothetical protein
MDTPEKVVLAGALAMIAIVIWYFFGSKEGP